MNDYSMFLLNTFGLSLKDSLIIVFLFIASFYIATIFRKMQKESFKRAFDNNNKINTKLEMLKDWLDVDLQLAFKIYTKDSKNKKHCLATYLTQQETLDNMEFITNIQGAKYITSSINIVRLETKKANDIAKSLIYLIDNSGVSYIIVSSTYVNFILEANNEEHYEIFYIVENIFVVEKDKLSKLNNADTKNLLFINKNIDNLNYYSYKDIVISNLTISGKNGYFTITDIDNPKDFIVHKFKIELKDIFNT